MKLTTLISAFALTTGLAYAQQTSPDTTNAAPVESSKAVEQQVEQPIKQSIEQQVESQVEPQQEPAPVQQVESSLPEENAVTTQASATATDSLTATEAKTDTVAAAADTATAVQPNDTANVQSDVQRDSVPAVAEKPQQTEAPVNITKIEPPKSVLAEGTPLKGSLQGFLKADKSPYLVTEDITIDENAVLVIEPGVVLQFSPGTGLYANGHLVIAGTRNNTVTLKSAMSIPHSGEWKGVFIASSDHIVIKDAVISDAAYAIAIENGSLEIQSSKINNTSMRGIYAKNSELIVNSSQFTKNAGIAIHIDSYSDAKISNVKLEENNVAIFNAPLAITDITSSSIQKNAYGVLDYGNSLLNFDNTQVTNNKVGASTGDVLSKNIIASVQKNELDFSKNFKFIIESLPANPVIPGVNSRTVGTHDKIEDLLAQKNAEKEEKDTTQKKWSIIGNVLLGGHYHHVITAKNKKKFPVEVSGDSILPGKHFENTFQVPGFGAKASVYLLMQSTDGKSIEFNTDLTTDSWNHFSPNPVTIRYTDAQNKLVFGDFNLFAGDIYMSSLPIFGIGYTRFLLTNNANQPLVEISGFFGESRKPYLIGDRHPTIYKNYIEDGEAQAQRIAYGGSVKWAPLRRFDATFGFIYANDEIHDPLLRDGGSKTSVTSEPLQQAFTMYADGNWLFYPGDIELNGQIAVGRADTADVYRERAINKVFTQAGLNTSSMSKLRQLMADESKINSLSPDELDEIFGGNTTLNRSKMRDSLRTLIREAKHLKNDYEDDRDEDRVLGLNWGSQNFAIGASLYWNIYKTTISGKIRYVGEDFYSAGAADQLADSREFSGNLEQIITTFWTLNFGYRLNIENAAKYGQTNLFGLQEGSRWGLFSGESKQWFEEHELDNDRTKYIQNWTLDNNFAIGKKINLKVGYNLEYRTQYRPYQLHGDYVLDDEIYKDRWFAARTNSETSTIINGKDTTIVDAARWKEYENMATEDYLASKFQERIYKNTWQAEVSIKAFHSIFKVGGRWTLRTDDSKFYKDSLISLMELSKETIAKLGYYFGGADFFEHAYPMSVNSTFKICQNRLSIVPRFKNYERDDMSESEISIEDEFEIPFMNRFLILGLNGEFRYLSTTWTENNKDEDETEKDVLFNTNLRVNHTSRLSSEWYAGTAMYYRPDNLSNEYKDIYGGVRVNYVF